MLTGVLCITLTLGLAGCGGSSPSNTTTTSTGTVTTAAPAQVDAATESTSGSSAVSAESAPTTEDTSASATSVEETTSSAEWEVGEGRVVTWSDSIGSLWVQVIVPVHNTGTKNLYLGSGTMDLEDAEGHLVESLSMVSVYPEVIQPGETAYYCDETILDMEREQELAVVPHVDVKQAKVDCIRYDVSDTTLKDEQFGGVAITGRVENTTDESESMIYVAAILFDAEGVAIGKAFTIVSGELGPGEKIGFSSTMLSAPKDLKADSIDHYEVFAYPVQFQF